MPTAQYAPVAPGGQPPSTKGKGKGLIVGLGIAGVAAIAVAAVLVFGGSDDPASVAPTTTVGASTTMTAPVTEPAATLPVLTTPEVVDTTIASPWGDMETSTIVDETGTFSVQAPVEWESSDGQRTLFGANAVGVSAAPNLDDYVNGDDALGVTVAIVLSADVSGAMGLASSYLDAVDTCNAEDQQSDVPTSLGFAELLLFDGCGTGAMYAKVVYVIEQGTVTVMVAGQGLGPADGDLLTVVQASLDTVTYL